MVIFFSLIFMLVALWITISHRASKKRFTHLAQERQGRSICQFARSFDFRNVDTKLIRVVYTGLQSWAAVPNFPVAASDDLGEVYGIVDDDLDYFAEEIAIQTGRTLIHAENNPFFDHVKTAKDLILFLNHQPKASVWKSIYF